MMSKYVILAALVLAATTADAANPIVRENAKPGHKNWGPHKPARNGEIEGYASKTSVNRGEAISFFVNTAEEAFTLEVFRMGWYRGDGARRVHGPIKLPGRKQPLATRHEDSGLVECNWEKPYTIVVPGRKDPTDWPSGVFLVRLTAFVSKRDAFIIFVVRDDDRASDLLFQSSVTTFQAYNSWGGKSLYGYNSIDGKPASRVSFNRPYAMGEGNGASHFAFGGGWEYCMLRFLEREGFDVTYTTNIDVHENASRLLKHKAFLSVGHDEYWSWEMREAITAARDSGVHLGVFSANTAYWQIRLEPGTDGHPHRTIVAHKEVAIRDDPYARDADPGNDRRITTKWRNAPVSLPESSLLGVMYAASPVKGDIVIEAADHWVFEGTGLKPGSVLEGLLGYEVDAMGPDTPPGTVRLAHSPYVDDGVNGHSHMTIYETPKGTFVFNTGSIYWSWGLDDFNTARARRSVLNPAAQRITRNILHRFIGRPARKTP